MPCREGFDRDIIFGLVGARVVYRSVNASKCRGGRSLMTPEPTPAHCAGHEGSQAPTSGNSTMLSVSNAGFKAFNAQNALGLFKMQQPTNTATTTVTPTTRGRVW